MKLRSKPKDSAEGQKPEKQKTQGILVDKFEFSDNTVKFYVVKGFAKKQWVSIREIPVPEITQIDKFGNELTITWKNTIDRFYTKEKTDSFGKLVEQVTDILEKSRLEIENHQRAELKKTELLMAVENSLKILDRSFDILIGLQDKRINWQQLEAHANGFSDNLNFTGQILPPLILDYGKIEPAVRKQEPKEASAEAFSLLKATYDYFDGLSPDLDINDSPPTLQTVKNLIYAYFLLNDLLLGKAVGEKDNSKETATLETTLKKLFEANFNLDFTDLKNSIDTADIQNDKRSLIDNCRTAFKEHLRHISEKPQAPLQTQEQAKPETTPEQPVTASTEARAAETDNAITPTEVSESLAAQENTSVSQDEYRESSDIIKDN